jgi:hypothetical protein
MSEAENRNIEQLKTLSLSELVKYKSAALYTKAGISIAGVSCFLLVFMFSSTSILISIPLVFFISTLANIGVGVDAFLVEIRKNLLRFQSADK